MKKLKLSNITLCGVDCVQVERLLKAFEICEYYADFERKILLTSLSKNQVTTTGIEIINIDHIASVEQYSFFMIKKLNQYIHSNHALVIQHDGFILYPQAWTNEFLQYDYIGAPWWFDHTYNVGNGGFSLRSKKLLELLATDERIREYYPEDWAICRRYGPMLKKKGIQFAPNELAIRFSIEGHNTPYKVKKYGKIWDGQFGFHDLVRTDICRWKDKEKFFP